MTPLVKYRLSSYRHYSESFNDQYYDTPELVADARGEWMKTADVEAVLKDFISIVINAPSYQCHTPKSRGCRDCEWSTKAECLLDWLIRELVGE